MALKTAAGEKIEGNERFRRTAPGLVASGCGPAGDGDRCFSGVCALSGAPVSDESACEAGGRRSTRDEWGHLVAVCSGADDLYDPCSQGGGAWRWQSDAA